jgi:hypothetical protein
MTTSPIRLVRRLGRRWWTMVLLVGMSACFPRPGVTAATRPPQRKRTPSFRLVSIKAFLYYNQDRSFSPNVVDNHDFQLYNVFIGEGSAKSPSASTMVVVEVAGPPGGDNFSKVRLVARENGRVKLDRTVAVEELGRAGRSFVAFWLYDTGASPIKLSATLLGQSPSRSIEKTLPFQTGE